MSFLQSLFGHALQFVERLLAVSCLVSAGLWHASHPLQFRAVQVVGACYFGPSVVYALLPFLKIVRVVAAIGVDGVVVKFQNDGAHAVQEEAVVGHHQQSLVASLQKSLQPLNHLEVEVVGRLVEYQQVGLGNEHVGQRHALLLSARELFHRLVEVANLQLR